MTKRSRTSFALTVIGFIVVVGSYCVCNRFQRRVISEMSDPTGEWTAVVDEVEYASGLSVALADRVCLFSQKGQKMSVRTLCDRGLPFPGGLVFSEDAVPDAKKPTLSWTPNGLLITVSKDARNVVAIATRRAAVLAGLTVPIAGGTVWPVRLFFSLPLPDDARARIGEALERAPGFTWSRPGQLHFTLAFLGEQPSAAAALAVTAPGKLPAFELAIGGAGAFPDQRRPRVLWLGVTAGAAQLVALAAALGAELRAAGCTLDERPFRPHLTVARARGADRASRVPGRRSLPPLPSRELARFRATHVELVRSHLDQAARHETLKRFPLLD